MEFLSSPISQVFIYALITALATGLGALPFFFIKDISPSSNYGSGGFDPTQTFDAWKIERRIHGAGQPDSWKRTKKR